MSKPIALTIAPRDPKRELLARLEQAPAEHAAALLDGYELLQELHEHGVFTLARGVLGAKETLIETAAAEANKDAAIRAMRNAILLGKLLAAVDPEVLEAACSAVSATVGDGARLKQEPPTLLGVMKSLMSRDFRWGMGLANTLLGNMARRFRAGGKEVH
jgi:uncharacterized protein YjgD (DUF1641 family)